MLCLICQKKTTEKPQCPVNWKRYDSGAEYLSCEKDVTSFYEAGELNLAVDCRGNVLTWEMEFGFHTGKSFAMWQRSCRDSFNKTKLDRMMEGKMPVEIHSIKQTRSRMFLFSRRRSRHENDSPCSLRRRKC